MLLIFIFLLFKEESMKIDQEIENKEVDSVKVS